MRIVFISHNFYPEGNAPATRVYQMTRRWARAGHDVTVITTAPIVSAGIVYDGYENKWWQEEDLEGVRVVRVWKYVAANAGTKRRITSYLSFMMTAVIALFRLDRPDVVIATSPQFFSGWAGRVASKLRGIPFILEVRDLWPESIVAVGAMKESPIIRFLRWLEIRLYAGVRHIVTVGDGYKQLLVERGVDESLISVVENGVDLESFDGAVPSTAFRREFGLGERFVCAYVGTIGMASGLEIVLRAGERLRSAGRDDIRFLLVGDGVVRQKLESEIAERDLKNVVMTGGLPKERIPEVLASVDVCLVHLKRADLFRSVIPSKIFDAGAMRKPIILGVEGFAQGLVSEAGSGICIEPENEDELLAAVDLLAEQPDLASELGANGRLLVTRRYNYDLLADEYLTRLTEFLHGA